MARATHSEIDVFLAIAEHGSLRRAAAALGIRPPSVSYRLRNLERRIGTLLFFRTTRSVRLTDAGRALLARARPALAELESALEDARATGHARTGIVRVTLPLVAHDLTLVRWLGAFQDAYPEIELELSFNEAFEDVAAHGFHAGVRLGDLVPEDMVAVRLTPPFPEVVFASPGYLARHGRPKRPAELLGHNCIRYRYIASRRIAEWQFRERGAISALDVRGNLIVNSTSALIGAAREGFGIAWLFRPYIEPDLQAGALEAILERYAVRRPGYFLYFPRANTRIEAFRVFVDFMRARATEAP